MNQKSTKQMSSYKQSLSLQLYNHQKDDFYIVCSETNDNKDELFDQLVQNMDTNQISIPIFSEQGYFVSHVPLTQIIHQYSEGFLRLFDSQKKKEIATYRIEPDQPNSLDQKLITRLTQILKIFIREIKSITSQVVETDQGTFAAEQLTNSERFHFEPTLWTKIEPLVNYLKRETNSHLQFVVRDSGQVIHCTQILTLQDLAKVDYYCPLQKRFFTELDKMVFNFGYGRAESLHFYDLSRNEERSFNVSINTEAELNWLYHTMMWLLEFYVNHPVLWTFSKQENSPLLKSFPFPKRKFSSYYDDPTPIEFDSTHKLRIRLSLAIKKERARVLVGRTSEKPQGQITTRCSEICSLRLHHPTTLCKERWIDLTEEPNNFSYIPIRKNLIQFFHKTSFMGQCPYNQQFIQRLDDLGIAKRHPFALVAKDEKIYLYTNHDDIAFIDQFLTMNEIESDFYEIVCQNSNYFARKSELRIESPIPTQSIESQPTSPTLKFLQLGSPFSKQHEYVDHDLNQNQLFTINGKRFFQLKDLLAFAQHSTNNKLVLVFQIGQKKLNKVISIDLAQPAHLNFFNKIQDHATLKERFAVFEKEQPILIEPKIVNFANIRWIIEHFLNAYPSMRMITIEEGNIDVIESPNYEFIKLAHKLSSDHIIDSYSQHFDDLVTPVPWIDVFPPKTLGGFLGTNVGKAIPIVIVDIEINHTDYIVCVFHDAGKDYFDLKHLVILPSPVEHRGSNCVAKALSDKSYKIAVNTSTNMKYAIPFAAEEKINALRPDYVSYVEALRLLKPQYIAIALTAKSICFTTQHDHLAELPMLIPSTHYKHLFPDCKIEEVKKSD